MRTIPFYTYLAVDGRSIRFATDSDFWITDLAGDDGLDIDTTTQQSMGQVGKSVIGQSVGSRSITVTGSILRDLDANERLLKQLIRPMEQARWVKTVGNTTWYLDVLPAHTPDVNGGENCLHYQFKLLAAYPYWRTLGSSSTLLGGLQSTWFPTPVSTAGQFAISRYKQSLNTNVRNEGNAKTGFALILRATARVKNPMLWHNGSRTYIRLLHEMLPGERAVISTEEDARGCTYYAADGTAENAFRLLDVDSDLWMVLRPGDNILRLTAEEGRESLTATIQAPKGVASGV